MYAIVQFDLAEFFNVRETSCHPYFKDNCPTFVTSVGPLFLVDKFTFLFLVLLKKMRILDESKVLLNELRVLGKLYVLYFFVSGVNQGNGGGEGSLEATTGDFLKNSTIFARKHLC